MAAVSASASKMQDIEAAIEAQNYAEAESELKKILNKPYETDSELREHEKALTTLGALYRTQKKVADLAQLIKESRSFMSRFAKSKTAKLVRTLIDFIKDIPDTLQTQVDVTKDSIDWAVSEKRVFLRQNLETRLVSLYIELSQFQPALALIETLLSELKKLDDKIQLVEVHLLESRIYHLVRNMAKSRSALTSAKTAGNSVYCPPLLQASLDNQSGILHAEEKDYETAYSYFYEAFEGYSQQNDPRASSILKYMLLSKIMLNHTDDVHTILTGKMALKYVGRNLDAMKSIALAHQNRSLSEFEASLAAFKTELGADPIIRSHFTALYDTLLEQNLVRVIEPFSCVEIVHVARQVDLSPTQVEGKLSQMVLDKIIYGVIDQETGTLIIYDEPEEDKTYNAALETIQQMSTVVDLLYEKALRQASSKPDAKAIKAPETAEKKKKAETPAAA